MQLQGQHVLILGLGASGLAMARWCARAGAEVSVADTRDAPPQLAALATASAQIATLAISSAWAASAARSAMRSSVIGARAAR